jgi:Ca-activated chloride channel family protein
MLSFGVPALLILLFTAPAVIALFIWGMRRRRAALAQLAGSNFSRLVHGETGGSHRRVKLALLAAGVALLSVAAALPQAGSQHIILPQQGSDVVLVMDVSLSMGVSDVSPSRLDKAKQAAGALVDHLGGDRVGMVVFAGSAVARSPLTTDLQSARQVVDSVAVQDSGVKGATDLAAGLRAANDMVKEDQTRSKVLVVITDGEDLAGNDLAAASEISTGGVLIETVGVGTIAGGQVIAVNPVSGARTPVIDPDTGTTAVSHRDDGNLRQLASAGRGSAYDGNTTDFAFDLSNAIDKLVPTRFSSSDAIVPFEFFQIPLAFALAVLLIDTLLLERRRRAQRASVGTPVRSQKAIHGVVRIGS